MTRHVLSITDLSAQEIGATLDAAELAQPASVLAGLGVGLIFEHPSARTRNSSEMAVFQLGGHPVTIRGEEIGFDRRESVEDIARTLGCYYAGIGARVAKHSTLERMAGALDGSGMAVPVMNLLSDREHPTQCLADLLTIRQQLGGLSGRQVAFIGDANNVCRSLAFGLALTGGHLRVASPPGYGPEPEDLIRTESLGGTLEICDSPEEAARDADVLYTDVWVSMGEETEAGAKRRAFQGYTISDGLVDLASSDAIVLHCLPAHREEEISTSVLEGRRSRVFEQAANRMHAMRGLLLTIFGDEPS